MSLIWTIWREGKYIDLWYLNHGVAGLCLGSIFSLTEFSFLYSFSISLVLLIAWEIFEIKNNIRETAHNRVLDVIVGVICFILMWSFSEINMYEAETLIGLLILCAILNSWGFIAWKKGINDDLFAKKL